MKIEEKEFSLRLIPLGGVVGVTKNMYVYELSRGGKISDILIVDCGIGFPNQQELGINLVLPDIDYLRDKTHLIRAVLVTHGHEDHIGALPYYYTKLGKPRIITGKLTRAFLMNKFMNFDYKASVEIALMDKIYPLGNFQVEFIRTTHSIPDTMHLLIKTPVGNFYHGSDFKLDLTPVSGQWPDFYKITKAGHEGVLCLLSDSLGSEREGLTLSESEVGKTLDKAMAKTKGKFIMTTFSSNISRVRQCIEAAVKYNRKIVFMGRSTAKNVRIAKEIGYLSIPHGFEINEKEIAKYPPSKVCLIVAGSQGQYGSAMAKLASKQNHFVKITPNDKVVISSDPIPGNEVEVFNLIEELSLQGAEVVYTSIQDQLHASGHGNKEDLKFLIRFVNPQYFIPIGGTIRHQRQYQHIVTKLGYPKKSVLMINEGETVVFRKGKKPTEGKKIITKNIYIDITGVNSVEKKIIKERQSLAARGMVVLPIVIDKQMNLLVEPKIISRGFVSQEEESSLSHRLRGLVETVFKKEALGTVDREVLRIQIARKVEKLFIKEKGKKPLVIVSLLRL